MAFKWKYPTASTLNEDLEISSSDEDYDLVIRKTYKDEDALLCIDEDEDNSKIPSTSAPSSSTTEVASSVKATEIQPCSSKTITSVKSSSVDRSVPIRKDALKATAELEDGEIAYDNLPGDPMSSSSSATRAQAHRNAVSDMDLDEICKQRNILPPPKAPRNQHHRFHHDRPITGVRSKFYNVDPRQNLSLDEIIRMIPPGGHDHQTIKRRQHYVEANRRPAHQQQPEQQHDKLKKGVETIAENHPGHGDVFKDVLPDNQEQQQARSNQVPEWSPDAWHCVSILINKGYSIYWSLMKLKNCEYLTEDEETRMYRCIVSYNHVQGICEAGRIVQAKHGAAADFMKKLSKEFPLLGKFTMSVNEALLLDPSLFTMLITKMKEKNGGECKFRWQMQSQKIGNHALYKCTLYIESSKYEACSYLSSKSAKLLASKIAYEDLLKEPCPTQKIHMDMEQCTANLSLYRGVESQMVHCYDFSRATIIDPETVRTSMSIRRGNPFRVSGFPRHGKSIQVSFVDPQNNGKH